MPPIATSNDYTNQQAGKAHVPNGSTLLPGSVLQSISAIAGLSVPVLLIGEPGTGKRRAASLIHDLGAGGTFNCLSASDVNRLANHGYNPRSFCQAAGIQSPGTICISENEQLEASAQNWLWHALCLEPGQFGSLRFVLTCNQELDAQVRNGRLRPDLHYFLGTISLRLAPLRYRKHEIPSVIDYFVADFAAMYSVPKPVITPDFKNRLLDHSWPGNLDEMEMVMKTLVVLGSEQVAEAAMDATTKQWQEKNKVGQISLKAASRAAVLEAERELILDVMARTNQNRKRAAEQLQISYKALLYKLRQNGWENPSSIAEGEEL